MIRFVASVMLGDAHVRMYVAMYDTLQGSIIGGLGFPAILWSGVELFAGGVHSFTVCMMDSVRYPAAMDGLWWMAVGSDDGRVRGRGGCLPVWYIHVWGGVVATYCSPHGVQFTTVLRITAAYVYLAVGK